jgi:orotate phosphoribosyltransferase
MSTGRNEIKSVTDLIKWLKLENVNFHDCDSIDMLSQVWASVESIWENVDLDNYTDHSLKHSLAIIDYFLQLDKSVYNWSSYERFIFAISSLIHDIGMQYNKWGFSVELSDLPKPPLSPNDIRKYHTITGFELIEKQFKNGSLKGFPKRFFDNKSWGQSNAIFHAQYIAFAHSGEKYLNKLLIGGNTWKMRGDYQGGVFRPRLLAGTLRMCDELDADFERIPQPNRIEACNLGETTRTHWFSCLFVEKTELEIGKEAIYINIKWQVPSKSTGKQCKLIKDFLRRKREIKIQREIYFINKFYEKCNERCHCKISKNIYVNPLSIEPILTKFPIDYNIINKLLKKSEKKRSQTTIPEFRIFKEKLTMNKEYLSEGFYETEEYIKQITRVKSLKLDILLENWFEENRESGHFELINGDHTDTYLYCRTLVSNQELLHKLTKHIWKLHKGHNIKNVLAIGTSAIPLAVNLSFRFRCFSTYTVWSRSFLKNSQLGKINRKNIIKKRENYVFSELIPSIRDGENILIIDDVISSGRVVIDVLDFIEKGLGKKIGKIYHHAIFRLGNRKFSDDKRITEYAWVKHIQNIMYASSIKECPFCQKGGIPQKEEDMY